MLWHFVASRFTGAWTAARSTYRICSWPQSLARKMRPRRNLAAQAATISGNHCACRGRDSDEIGPPLRRGPEQGRKMRTQNAGNPGKHVASAPQALAPIRNWSAMASMLPDSLRYAAFVKSRRGSHGAEHGNRKGRGIASRRDGGLFKRSTALFERAPARPLPYRSRSENRTHQPASDSSADPTRPAASSRSARPLLARAKLIACNWKRDGLRSSPPRTGCPSSSSVRCGVR